MFRARSMSPAQFVPTLCVGPHCPTPAGINGTQTVLISVPTQSVGTSHVYSPSGGRSTRSQHFSSGHSVHFGRRAMQMARP